MNLNPLSFQHWEIRKPRSPADNILETLMLDRKFDSSFFSLSYEKAIHDPLLFQEMGKTVDRIIQAKNRGEGILIAGDYDLDGISGTALLLDFFRYIRMPVKFKLPHRVEDGYGLNTKTIIEAHKAHIKVIITVDNGISCFQEITLAKSLGIDVIITDHHTIPEKIPPAFAILHPKLSTETYPDKELTGSGVAYKLTCALARHILTAQEAENFCKWSLDLAALGTIADMGPLLGENRQLVHFGLQVLSKQKRPGLRKLLQLAGHNDLSCSADVVGFKIAPRLNAAGRMASPDLSVQLLLSANEHEASDLASAIEQLNNDRKIAAEKSFLLADKQIVSPQSSVLFAQSEDFHPGVIGLAASRLVEKYQRPAIILELRGDVGIGSMRSIPGIDLIPILHELKPFFIKYGGHAQAAGFAIAREKVTQFLHSLEDIFDAFSPLPPPTLTLDTHLYASDISLESCTSLEKLEPFGIANKKPLFYMSAIQLQEIKPLGKDNKHWKLELYDNSTHKSFQGVAFNMSETSFQPEMNLAVRLGINSWNGHKSPQVIIEHIQNKLA